MNNHLCGAGMGLLGFTTTLIIGLMVGNPFLTIVWRAIQILVLFYFLGYFLCHLGLKAVKENFMTEAEIIRQKEISRRKDAEIAEQRAEAAESDTEDVVNPDTA